MVYLCELSMLVMAGGHGGSGVYGEGGYRRVLSGRG